MSVPSALRAALVAAGGALGALCAPAPAAERPPACGVAAGPETLAVLESTPDVDGDGRFEALVVRARVPVRAPGEYLASVRLLASRPGNGPGERVVATGEPPGAHVERAAEPLLPVRADSAGAVPLEIAFDGEAIRREAPLGALLVRFEILSAPGASPGRLDRYLAWTRPLNPRRFGRYAVHVDSVAWCTEAARRLVLDLDLDVARRSAAVIEANAWVGEAHVGQAAFEDTLERGRRVVTLAIETAAGGPIGAVRGDPERLRFELRAFEGGEPADAWRGSAARARQSRRCN